jgi:methionine-rich copper-binding protein CopC
MSKGNDVILLQQTSTAIVGAGEGDDRYILNSALLAPNQKITISDTQGSNTLHLVGGLTITGSKVTNDALLLTLSNGAEVTLLGANTFKFMTGGDSLTGQGAQTSIFSDFVTKDLGYTAVPAPGAAPSTSTTPVTVNNTGGTSGGGSGGTSGGGGGGGQTFTLTPASGQVTEGNPLSFTLKAAQKVAADTTFTVIITGDDNGGTVSKASAADFPANVVSSVTIQANSDSATFDLTPVANDGTEGLEGFKVTLLDSTNKAVANSGVVLIKDGVTDTTAPVIDANQSFAYAENQAKGFVVGTVKASDVGAGGGAGTIATFEIVGGNDNGFFAIDKDGKITLTEAGAGKTSAANDFETAPNTFTLKVRAIDAAGNKSAGTDVTLTVTDVDDTGPKFVSAAASGTQVKINFDEALKTVTLPNPSALFTVTQGGTSYSISTATISGNTVTLTLASALGTTGDIYIAYDGTVLEDALGNKADKIASTKVTSTDTTPPTLTSSNPADDATDFAANANLTLTFNEAVKLGIGTITLVNTKDATDNRVINVQDVTQVSVSGKTVTINPTADLKENASYAVNISPTAILDSAGNAFAGISDNTTLNFTTKAATSSTPGQTFTLTTSIDNIVGTAGDDTIIGGSGSAGSASTLGSADVINGAGGTDTLKLTVEGNAPVTVTPNLTSVEKVFIQTIVTGGGNTATVNMVNATGTTEIWNDHSTNDLVVNNVQELATVGVKGEIPAAIKYQVAFKDSLASGPSDSVNIALDGATITDLGVGGMTAANEFETLNISATGTNTVTNLKQGTGAAALAATKSINVTGAGKLTVTAAVAATVTSVDASGNTGGVSFDLSATGVVTAKGSSGNDTFKMGASLTTADVLTGGDGTDIIGVTTGASLVNGLQVTGFETLDIGGADNQTGANAYDVSKLSGITTLKVGSALNGTTVGGIVTVNNLAKGAGVEINAAVGDGATDQLQINVKDAGAGSPNDTISVLVKGAAAINTTGIVDINDIETVTLTADKSTATGAVTHTFANFTDDEALTINVANGNAGLTFADLNAKALVLFDATAATQAVSVTTNDAFTATNGVAFKLGQAADTLVLTGATTAGGDFFITGGAGGDRITLTAPGSEVEHLVYTAGHSLAGKTSSGATKYDVVINFDATADLIDLKALGIAAAQQTFFTKGTTGTPTAITDTGEVAAADKLNFFINAGAKSGVVVAAAADVNGNNAGAQPGVFVYVDANGDGNFDAAQDLTIALVGVTIGGANDLAAGNFVFA